VSDIQDCLMFSVTGSFDWASHDAYPSLHITSVRSEMQASWPDSLWARMMKGKYYTMNDLANLTGQPRSIVAEVLCFLTKYGFVRRIGVNDPVFTKTSVILSPTDSINLLKCIAKS